MAQAPLKKCYTCNDKEGSRYCYECKKFLCETCEIFHAKFTKGHNIKDSKDIDNIQLRVEIACKNHHQEYSFYCKKCACLICDKCALDNHRRHDLCQVHEKAKEIRDDLKRFNVEVKTKTHSVLEKIRELKTYRRDVLPNRRISLETGVKDTSKEMVGIIDSVFQQSLSDIKTTFESECDRVEFIFNKLTRKNESLQQLESVTNQKLTIEHDITLLAIQHKDKLKDIEEEEFPNAEFGSEEIPFDQAKFVGRCIDDMEKKFWTGTREYAKLQHKFESMASKCKDIEKTNKQLLVELGILKETNRMIVREKEERIQRLRGKSKRKKNEIKQLKVEKEHAFLRCGTENRQIEYETLLEKYKSVVSKCKEAEDKNQQIVTEVKGIMKESKEKAVREIEEKNQKLRQMEDEIKQLRVEKENALSRCGTENRQIEYETLLEKYESVVSKCKEAEDKNQQIVTEVKGIMQESKEKAVRESEEKNQKLKEKLRQMEDEIKQLRIEKENALSSTEIRKNEYETLLEKYESVVSKYKEAEDKNQQIVSKVKRFMKESKEKAVRESEEKNQKLREKLRQMEDEIKQLRVEKENALSRLSKHAEERFNNEKPGIAELNDPNSLWKIVEKYNSLFDNEWADALERLSQSLDEETGVRFLLEIKKHIYRFCTKARAEMLHRLFGVLENPLSPTQRYVHSADQSANNQFKQMVDVCVKTKTNQIIENLNKEYMKLSNKPRFADRLPEYTNKCMEVCWLMNIHSPPLVFAEIVSSGQTYDKDLYREFTKQGEIVSFVVWLPMLIEHDGAVLSKGVVQPVPSAKPESKRGASAASKAREKSNNQETHNEQFRQMQQEEEPETRLSTSPESKNDVSPFSSNINGSTKRQETSSYSKRDRKEAISSDTKDRQETKSYASTDRHKTSYGNSASSHQDPGETISIPRKEMFEHKGKIYALHDNQLYINHNNSWIPTNKFN